MTYGQVCASKQRIKIRLKKNKNNIMMCRICGCIRKRMYVFSDTEFTTDKYVVCNGKRPKFPLIQIPDLAYCDLCDNVTEINRGIE